MADESDKQPRPAEQAKREQAQTDEPRTLPARPFPARQGEQVGDDLRLTRDAWKDRAGLLSVSPHAVAGALSLHDPEEEISAADVRRALDEFSVRQGV